MDLLGFLKAFAEAVDRPAKMWEYNYNLLTLCYFYSYAFKL